MAMGKGICFVIKANTMQCIGDGDAWYFFHFASFYSSYSFFFCHARALCHKKKNSNLTLLLIEMFHCILHAKRFPPQVAKRAHK